MTTDVPGFYTKNLWLLNATIAAVRYLPALRALWRKYIAFWPGIKILDAGCGTGALVKTMVSASPYPAHYCAFDVTPRLLHKFCRWAGANRRPGSFEIVEADIISARQELPPVWRNFDIICSSGVLEYLEPDELGPALRHFKELLAPHGILVTITSRKNFSNKLLIEKLYRAMPYRPAEFAEALKKAGFRSATFWRFPFPYSYLNFWGYIVVAGA